MAPIAARATCGNRAVLAPIALADQRSVGARPWRKALITAAAAIQRLAAIRDGTHRWQWQQPSPVTNLNYGTITVYGLRQGVSSCICWLNIRLWFVSTPANLTTGK